MQITDFFSTKNCPKSDGEKFQIISKCNFSKLITNIICRADSIVYDERGPYCCRYKCLNYATRCYCPPYSNNLAKIAKSKKYAIIFAKTYDFSEINHFQNRPRDRNPDYLFKKRVFVRRWVQHHFYSGIKEIFAKWGYNQNDLFAGGFSLSKCTKCYENSPKELFFRKKSENCFSMPSPEALGIDVPKTLANFNYYLEFGVKTHMTKVSMLFTDDISCEPYLNQKVSGNDNVINNFPQIIDFKGILKKTFPDIDFIELKKINYLDALEKGFEWLGLWDRAILWKSTNQNIKKIQAKIHEIVFMQYNYYALDFLVKDIFKPNFEKSDFIGVEFL